MGHGAPINLKAVPLFPLPNVVLFPRAILPLHIFEERYKEMTADVLRGGSQIAMALLSPGWERDYHCTPAIESVVCVGTILSHERLADGRFNFLLQGQCRARVVREDRTRAYRVAELEMIRESAPPEIEIVDFRRQLLERFAADAGAASVQICRLLNSSMTTPDVADVIAFTLIENVQMKQSLLADGDLARRLRRLIEALSCWPAPAAAVPALTPRNEHPELN